jgi:Uma2 family endonuclease
MEAVTTIPRDIPLSDQQHLVLDDVSWEFYEQLLREIGDRAIRVTYDNGWMEIMSPLPKHERWKTRIGRMIEILSLELRVPVETLGSTTFKREDRKKGLEPDECYYVQNEAAVRDKDELDLTIDPAPDLAVEVDITRRSIPRQPIYAALGMPELWRFEGKRLLVLHLAPDGKYHAAEASVAFPFLPMKQFEAFVLRLKDEEQIRVLCEFRDWVHTLPRP